MSTANPTLKYLAGYPESLQQQVHQLITQDKLGDYLLRKYPKVHHFASEKELYQYAQQIKNQYLRQSAPITKVVYDDKIQVINHALGLHSQVARVQGRKLKSKNEIRIASVFKRVPLAFLRMILVHELAHIREKNHDKAFYRLCQHMEPDYHQLELDVRLFLLHRDQVGPLY